MDHSIHSLVRGFVIISLVVSKHGPISDLVVVVGFALFFTICVIINLYLPLVMY